MSTRLLPSFDYYRPSSLEDALHLLAAPDAQALAGGQSLIPLLKLGFASPATLVDIARLPLGGVTGSKSTISIGALTTWAALAKSEDVCGTALAIMIDVSRQVGDMQIRSLGTVGGALSHADPTADIAAVLVALDANIHLRSSSQERQIPAGQFVMGAFSTALQSGELLTHITVARRMLHSSAYVSLRDQSSGMLKISAAAVCRGREARIVIGGIDERPFELNPVGSLESVAWPRHARDYEIAVAIAMARRARELAIARHDGENPRQ